MPCGPAPGSTVRPGRDFAQPQRRIESEELAPVEILAEPGAIAIEGLRIRRIGELRGGNVAEEGLFSHPVVREVSNIAATTREKLEIALPITLKPAAHARVQQTQPHGWLSAPCEADGHATLLRDDVFEFEDTVEHRTGIRSVHDDHAVKHGDFVSIAR